MVHPIQPKYSNVSKYVLGDVFLMNDFYPTHPKDSNVSKYILGCMTSWWFIAVYCKKKINSFQYIVQCNECILIHLQIDPIDPKVSAIHLNTSQNNTCTEIPMRPEYMSIYSIHSVRFAKGYTRDFESAFNFPHQTWAHSAVGPGTLLLLAVPDTAVESASTASNSHSVCLQPQPPLKMYPQ
jgi:hypothetical protein